MQDKELVKHIRRTARVYPEAYRMMQHAHSLQDLEEYAEVDPGKLHIRVTPNSYLLLGEHTEGFELVDFASTVPVSFSELREYVTFVTEKCAGHYLTLDAREGTSWKILKFLLRHHPNALIREEEYDWDGETFHDCTLLIPHP